MVSRRVSGINATFSDIWKSDKGYREEEKDFNV